MYMTKSAIAESLNRPVVASMKPNKYICLFYTVLYTARMKRRIFASMFHPCNFQYKALFKKGRDVALIGSLCSMLRT